MHDTYVFQVLATTDALEPICKHPYITAFVDIHFSVLQKIQHQLRDSVPHFVLMLFLLQISTIYNLHSHSKSKYGTWIASIILTILLVLEGITFIGLNTKWAKNRFQASMVRKNSGDERNRRR